MPQNASKTQQKGLPPLQDNTASTPPSPLPPQLIYLDHMCTSELENLIWVYIASFNTHKFGKI